MKRKQGFTIVELVVAIVMACILLAALTPLLPLAQRGTYEVQRSTRVTQAGDAIYEYITGLLKNAEQVYIGDAGTYRPADWEHWNRIAVSRENENGVLTVNDTKIYPLEYQESCALTLSATGQNRNQLTLWVALADNRSNETLYSKSSTLVLAGLEDHGFGQIQGLVGEPVNGDGFDGFTTVGSAADVGSLVIYYKGGGSVVPDFAPDGGNHPAPTPGPSVFSVTLPARFELEAGQQQRLAAYVTWPAGITEAEKNAAIQNAKWELAAPAGAADFLRVTGNLTAAPDLQATLHGLKATGDAPVTVRVTLSAGGKTASATCLVSVWEESGGEIEIRDTNIYDSKTNLANTTILRFVGSEIRLKAYYPNGNINVDLIGPWESDNDVLATTLNNEREYRCTPFRPGVATLTFTAKDRDGGGDISAVLGKKAQITIVVIDKKALSFDLSFLSSGSNTAHTYFTGTGTQADTVVCKAYIDESLPFRTQIIAALKGTAVQLATGDRNNLWGYTFIQRPAPAFFNAPLDPDPAYALECSIPLYFAAFYNEQQTLSNIGLSLYDSTGTLELVSFADIDPLRGKLALTAYKKPSGDLNLTVSNSAADPGVNGTVLRYKPGDMVSLYAFYRQPGAMLSQPAQGYWNVSVTPAGHPSPSLSGTSGSNCSFSIPSTATPGDAYQILFKKRDPDPGYAFVTIQVADEQIQEDALFSGTDGTPITQPLSLEYTDAYNPFTIFAPPSVQNLVDSRAPARWKWKIRETGAVNWVEIKAGSAGNIGNFLQYSFGDEYFALNIWKNGPNANKSYEITLEYLPADGSWAAASTIVTATIK